MASKETLKAKRHQLYCSIADALNHTGAESSDILDRLQAVFEAEACLSVIDDDADSGQHTPHDSYQQCSVSSQQQTATATQRAQRNAPAVSNSRLMSCVSSKGQAASALQQLKQELAQQVHQSLQQTQQQSVPRKGKFLSCSSLLADLRAAQQTNADLEAQLQSANAAAAWQQKQQEQEVRKYRKAAEQATRLAEITNSRLLEAEQQIAARTQDAAGQTQQLAEQATCAIKLGAELRQIKQHMAQLHLSIVQPLLRWQHDQQLQQQEAEDCAATSSSSRGNNRHSLQRWLAPRSITADVIAAAAAAVEDLLLQQADQEHVLQAKLRSSHVSVLRDSCHKQAQLQEQVQQLQSELQQLREELEDTRQQASTAQQRADTLQQQLEASSLQLRQSEMRHSAAVSAAAQHAAEETQHNLQTQQQQHQMLQQEVNRLTSELACAQGEAAAAQRQVARLQDERQQAAADNEQRLQQLQQAMDARLSQESAAAAVAGVEHELRVQHMKALTAAGQEAQQASEAAAQAWQEQQAALEKQHLQALLRVRQAHEQDRQQWKKERDELVQQLTAEYTASGMQAHMQAKEEEQELQQQLRQLQQERDALLQRHTAATLHNPRHSATAVYCPSCQQLRSSIPQGNAISSMRASSSAGEPAAFAVQFSRALQIADADRNEAARRAAAAEQVAAELRQQLTRQELELDHLHRALEELRSACAAANAAAAEAEASAAASSTALQEQLVQVQQLQRQLDRAGELHQAELRALRQSMSEQVKVIQADARAELEAAQTRLQLVRLKQQRVVSSMLGTQAT